MARTTEEKALDYTAMGHSVDLINAVIAGSQMTESHYTATDRQSCVDRNVEHLELMKAKTDWGSEDMAATTKAISDGKAYKAS
jgi:hypothetical protein